MDVDKKEWVIGGSKSGQKLHVYKTLSPGAAWHTQCARTWEARRASKVISLRELIFIIAKLEECFCDHCRSRVAKLAVKSGLLQ